MPTGASCQPPILTMGTWPKLVDVTMPYEDSCAARRGTADVLRWSMGTPSRYGYDFTDDDPFASAAAPVSPAIRLSRIRERLKLAVEASLRLWSRLIHPRCRSLDLQSYPPPSPHA
jgi:hypothetical protein